MSRKLTTYNNPSIADRLAAAMSIEELGVWREALSGLFASGKLDPSEKTRREWNVRLWARVIELLQASKTPEEACFIYSTSLTWPKPDVLGRDLEILLKMVTAPMPNRAERWKQEGIVIVGVTDK